MVVGLVPSMSYVSANPLWGDCGMCSHMIRYKHYFHSLNGGTWSVTRNTQTRTKGHSDMTMGCSLTWSDISAGPFWCDWGICSHLIRYKGCCHSVMVRGLVPSMSDVSAEPFWYDCRIDSYMIRYKGYFHSLNGGTWSVTRNPQSRTECLSDESRSNVSVVPFWWVKVRCECWSFWWVGQM